MRKTKTKVIAAMTCLVILMLLPGCTNWKEKYEVLLAENANIKGELERVKLEKGQLTDRISKDQQTIDDLLMQIEEQKKTPADATGFGPGYDVAVDRSAGTITVTLPNAILFDSGQAALKKTTIRELDHIRSVLRDKYSGRQIDVVGHTDTDPIKKSKWRDNWQLSSERALSVLAYLEKRGIPADQIRAVGCGQSRPVASNATSAGKAKNRRVEIVVHMK
ncbi:MAG: OmpA family protein [Phycisphaerales bacterium]|nr:MAG: OmpA family protein [Phycisphaerales bacterium]